MFESSGLLLRYYGHHSFSDEHMGSVSSDPLQALRILIWLLRVIGQTFRIHPIEYTDTMYQLD